MYAHAAAPCFFACVPGEKMVSVYVWFSPSTVLMPVFSVCVRLCKWTAAARMEMDLGFTVPLKC